MFKVGSMVLCVDSEHTSLSMTVYKLTEVNTFWEMVSVSGKDSSKFSYTRFVLWNIKNNKLNRKLYPNYVEKDGYLIPNVVDQK